MVDKVELRRWMENGLKPKPTAPVDAIDAIEEKKESVDVKPTADVEMAHAIVSIPEDVVALPPDLLLAEEPTSPSPDGPKMDTDAIIADEAADVDPNIISNSGITCQHGMIDPRKAQRCKLVGQVSLAIRMLIYVRY